MLNPQLSLTSTPPATHAASAAKLVANGQSSSLGNLGENGFAAVMRQQADQRLSALRQSDQQALAARVSAAARSQTQALSAMVSSSSAAPAARAHAGLADDGPRRPTNGLAPSAAAAPPAHHYTPPPEGTEPRPPSESASAHREGGSAADSAPPVNSRTAANSVNPDQPADASHTGDPHSAGGGSGNAAPKLASRRRRANDALLAQAGSAAVAPAAAQLNASLTAEAASSAEALDDEGLGRCASDALGGATAVDLNTHSLASLTSHQAAAAAAAAVLANPAATAAAAEISTRSPADSTLALALSPPGNPAMPDASALRSPRQRGEAGLGELGGLGQRRPGDRSSDLAPANGPAIRTVEATGLSPRDLAAAASLREPAAAASTATAASTGAADAAVRGAHRPHAPIDDGAVASAEPASVSALAGLAGRDRSSVDTPEASERATALRGKRGKPGAAGDTDDASTMRTTPGALHTAQAADSRSGTDRLGRPASPADNSVAAREARAAQAAIATSAAEAQAGSALQTRLDARSEAGQTRSAEPGTAAPDSRTLAAVAAAAARHAGGPEGVLGLAAARSASAPAGATDATVAKLDFKAALADQLQAHVAPAAQDLAAGNLAGAPAPVTIRVAPAGSDITLATPVTSPLFAQSLGAQVSLLAKDGVQTAVLQLNPAEMGPITVQIVMDGSAARVEFQAAQADTRALIETSLPALAGALQDAGLTLAGGGVFEQPSGRQPPQAEPDTSHRQRGDSGRDKLDSHRSASSTSSTSSTSSSTSPIAGLRNTPARGLVDLLA